MAEPIPQIDWDKVSKDPLLKHKPFLIIHIIGFLLLLVSPENILDLFPALAVLVAATASFAPAIDVYGRWSDFPQLTQLYATYCILTIPLQAVIIFKHKPTWENFNVKLHENQTKKYGRYMYVFIPLLAITVLWLCLYLAVPYSPPGVKPAPYRMKWAMILWVGIGGMSGAGCIAMVWMWIKNWPVLYFDKKQEVGK